uniref:Uncharacterized protein n=1 Tax=Marseillevirus LCMAC102 TaxID=2506603 RepID=A0A481YVC1_9VIRU|nr:MAG: hypothetical protein LCMAC102_02410 [Marseillevirus LCMAC102]
MIRVTSTLKIEHNLKYYVIMADQNTDNCTGSIDMFTQHDMVITTKEIEYIFAEKDIEIKFEDSSFKVVETINFLRDELKELKTELSQLRTDFMYRPEGLLATQLSAKWNIDQKNIDIQITL